MSNTPITPFTYTIESEHIGQRLDQSLADFLKEITRSQVARLIDDGHVTVNGRYRKRSYRLSVGDTVCGQLAAYAPQPNLTPENIPLKILFEDPHLCVIDKPAGMVVHPAPGNYDGTLVNALLYHYKDLHPEKFPDLRPGIVHRLDKNTSGVIVVAKHIQAMERLARLFKSRQIDKTYLAIVRGRVKSKTGFIDLPIGRHPSERKRMAVNFSPSRSAYTEWHCLRRFGIHASLLKIKIKTGRTHQIRVHCAAMGHPTVGDPVYGGKREGQPQSIAIPAPRQLLHAWRLGFEHPMLPGHGLRFKAPLPEDMRRALRVLSRSR